MRKLFLAIAVAMMGILFAGCNKDVEPDRGVAQKIIGKWITADSNGKALPTNEKVVFDFISTTEAYVSLSFTGTSSGDFSWSDKGKADVEINGNDVTLTHITEPGTTVTTELHVDAITATTLIARRKITLRKEGGLVRSVEDMLRCEKVDVDYSTKILGLWEGKMTSERSAYDDGKEHRWEFKDDGTFVYFVRNEAGIWEPGDDTLNEYFVAGNLLCTRWMENGKENREWWEIATMNDKAMVWIALREEGDGSQYTAAFSMDKISFPTQAEVEASIRGKWMNFEVNGVPSLTNEKSVLTILTFNRGAISASLYGNPGMETVWNELEEVDVTIKDNVVSLISQTKPALALRVEMFITSINDQEMDADVTLYMTENGTEMNTGTAHVRYEKVKERFNREIQGVWEGRRTGGKSTHDDDEYHHWEYLDDGTYHFYRKVGETGSWEMVHDEFAEYFVDGRLLCTRWKNEGFGTEEQREWWEIRSIENETMIWTALREDEVGNRYVTSFAMTKVHYPSQADVEKNITGKWMTMLIEGDIAPTNDKVVFTMPSKTVAFVSTSFDKIPGESDWVFQREYNMSIESNTVTLVHNAEDGHTQILDKLLVLSIDEREMECVLRRWVLYDEEVTKTYPPVELTLMKLPKMPRYASYILGTWEGHVTSAHSVYDDCEEHRWQFNGGTYVYYMQEGDTWVPSSDTRNEYFVDGPLLCTRWIDNGVEYCECWEILSLDEHAMVWTAMRQDDTGGLYNSSFAMNKVEPAAY
ncbi:MAG: hypothetical protein IKN00_08835 [Bacteroidales bacterium]|nr:hypothetical protein [Bacteroidales bacterium]